MKPSLLALALLACAVSVAAAAGPALNVRDFGAAGDGKTLDTRAIQKAIDACSANAGGVVELPAGTYLSGSILLKDNVTLRLDQNATLLGSTNPADYTVIDEFTDGLGNKMGWALVGAADAKNVGIDGPGIIDGQGKAISAVIPTRTYGRRPFLVRFAQCHGVTLSGVQLQNAGSWTTNFFQCTDVNVSNLRIDSLVAVHNDGIDLDSCQRVKITGCDIHSGDDAICLKTTSPIPCTDFDISGCHLSTHQGAVKLGTESVGDFTNIHVSDCVFQNVSAGGIKLLSADGAHLTNVTVSGITMENVEVPIFIRLDARLSTFHPGEEKRPAGLLQHVLIENVNAVAATHGSVMPPTGILISGIPGHDIEDITLRNIQITLHGGGTAAEGKIQLPEQANGYPEINRFGKTLPAYGMYARHVTGLILQNVTFKLLSPDARPEVKCEDVQDYARN